MVESKTKKHGDQSAKPTNSEDIINHELVAKALARLNEIVCQEEELINQRKYSEATKLIQDKLELVNFFEKHRKKILESYTSDGKKDIRKKEDIKNLVQSLLVTSSRNMNKIKKAQYIGNKTMEIIKDIAIKDEAKHSNYSKKGKKDDKSRVNKHVFFHIET